MKSSWHFNLECMIVSLLYLYDCRYYFIEHLLIRSTISALDLLVVHTPFLKLLSGPITGLICFFSYRTFVGLAMRSDTCGRMDHLLTLFCLDLFGLSVPFCFFLFRYVCWFSNEVRYLWTYGPLANPLLFQDRNVCFGTAVSTCLCLDLFVSCFRPGMFLV